MNHVQQISQRLSLRAPQRESLEILSNVSDQIPLSKDRDVVKALETIKAAYPQVTDFERDFPSLCFALATGVGKTRLMGAFVSYLHLAKGIRNFFVLAPNLTIYSKLIKDFTPNTSKYVLTGISEFAANPPEIITGDNYEGGRGIREHDLYGESGVHINIFNISKISSEVRGGNSPRMRRLAEYIGESYFDYLSGLPDLVLIMDESHRYRASAGVRVINELKPILGLELTATPHIESGVKTTPFKNVIYSYPLSSALSDGFVKEPAVATRENFDVSLYNEEQLERLKLEDGIRIHEAVKVELEVYARQNNCHLVKPFILVVAADTTHAEKIVKLIKEEIFQGRYKDKVITVHSNQRGEESEETVAKLLAVEDPKEPTEIVVHVNMLKEGWDVTNLYTIIPLRAANSKTLVEQSIGRGLRLPYGKRTGVNAVDRLNIVAHDKFQQIIDEANNPNSVIHTGIVIGRDIPLEPIEAVIVQPFIETMCAPPTSTASIQSGAQQTMAFKSPDEQEAAKITLDLIQKNFQRLPQSFDLNKPEHFERLVKEASVEYKAKQPQGTLEGVVDKLDIPKVVEKTVALFIEQTIDIPRISILPKGEVLSGFKDFDLDVARVNLQPVPMDILLQELRTRAKDRIVAKETPVKEDRLENYVISGLMDFNDINYDRESELLYKLAGQLVGHFKSYLTTDDEIANVLQYHRTMLVEMIHTQMQPHHFEQTAEYEAKINKGFTTLRPGNFTARLGESSKNFRQTVEEKQLIRGTLFSGFTKCLYPVVRFQSDSERRLSVILEDDKEIMKWLKPEKGQIEILYGDGSEYIPDFAVEGETSKYLIEPKAANEMDDPIVKDKAKAAATWCRYASAHAKTFNGKPWSYLLIPHDKILDNMTVAGLAAKYVVK